MVNVYEVSKNIYLLDDNGEATGYLVIGSVKALLIDTMNGGTNLKELVSSITDKPVIVVNTHGHPDHIYGNMHFEKAYMNSKDLDTAQTFIESDDFVKGMKKDGIAKFPPFEDIKEGDVIDIGGKSFEVYEIPGHTNGGILLLLNEERILFTGDSINHFLWMQLENSLSLEETIESFDRLMFLETRADKILHGHSRGFDDIALFKHVRNAMQEIVDGKTENDIEYEWFGGKDMQHPYAISDCKEYQQNYHTICYKPSNIRKKGHNKKKD